MATYSGKPGAFPALAIVPLLLVFCLFPGQTWLAHFIPRLSGLATIDPGLIVLDTPIHLPGSIDLVLVPALFLALYTIVLLAFSMSRHLPAGRTVTHRLAAVLSGTFFFLLSVAIGGLISYVLLEQLPDRLQHNINAISVNADVHLPFLGYKTSSLHGNILSLLGLLVGIGIFLVRISRDPRYRRSTPLTREQRMTPYQRMLEERRRPAPPAFRCHNEPLYTLEPEAVNYRPLA